MHGFSSPASSYPRWMRRTAALCAGSFAWMVLFATPADVLAQKATAPHVPAPKSLIKVSAPKPRLVPPPASLKENLKPLTKQQIARLTTPHH